MLYAATNVYVRASLNFPSKKPQSYATFKEKNDLFHRRRRGTEGWAPLASLPEAAGRRCEGSARLSHAPPRLVRTGGPEGTQDQLPDGSERCGLLHGHRPVGRSVWQNAAICLPALTNPLRSPDTHIQTLFPSSPQGRKASVFGLAPLINLG